MTGAELREKSPQELQAELMRLRKEQFGLRMQGCLLYTSPSPRDRG